MYNSELCDTYAFSYSSPASLLHKSTHMTQRHAITKTTQNTYAYVILYGFIYETQQKTAPNRHQRNQRLSHLLLWYNYYFVRTSQIARSKILHQKNIYKKMVLYYIVLTCWHAYIAKLRAQSIEVQALFLCYGRWR